jgi:hypothetical protein
MSNLSTNGRVTAAQVLDAIADIACLPLGVSLQEWQRISVVLMAAARQLEQPSEPAADYTLPCDVKLPPNTVIGKGCKLSTLMNALRVREGQGVPRFLNTDAIDKMRNAETKEPKHE